MGTLIVGICVAGVAALAIHSMVKDRREGKSCHCGGDCGACHGGCHHEQ